MKAPPGRTLKLWLSIPPLFSTPASMGEWIRGDGDACA